MILPRIELGTLSVLDSVSLRLDFVRIHVKLEINVPRDNHYTTVPVIDVVAKFKNI